MAKSRKASAKQTLRRLLRDGATDLARHLTTVMTSDDPAGPHRARVTLRRLRVVLTAFKPLITRKLYARQQSALRDTFRLLGPLRDADVLAITLNQPALHAAAAKTRAEVRAALTAPTCTAFVATPGPAAIPANSATPPSPASPPRPSTASGRPCNPGHPT